MSREVLGAAGTEVETTTPGGPRSRQTPVTSLDAPDPDAGGRTLVRERPTGPARNDAGDRSGDADGVHVDLDGAASVPPSPSGAGGRLAELWRGSRWVLVAVAVVGAILGSMVSISAVQRQARAERLAALNIVADVSLTTTRAFEDGEPRNLDVVVLNAGQDPVDVVEVAFTGGTTSTIGAREPVAVGAGDTERLPAQVRVDCDGVRPEGLQFTVRTVDGREHTVTPSNFFSRVTGEEPLSSLFWDCHDRGSRQGVEVWMTDARDDGTLGVQLRNPSDDQVSVTFRGPSGTRVVSEPPSPVVMPGRSGDFVRLRVEVDRCTESAQRAEAADDVMIVMNDDWMYSMWSGTPDLAGWFARSVALQCGIQPTG